MPGEGRRPVASALTKPVAGNVAHGLQFSNDLTGIDLAKTFGTLSGMPVDEPVNGRAAVEPPKARQGGSTSPKEPQAFDGCTCLNEP